MTDVISVMPEVDESNLDEDIQTVYAKCRHKLGLVPNVIQVMAYHPRKLRNFMATYNELMLGESELSKLEREMIAVVVSSHNECEYCLASHGAAVRVLSGNSKLDGQLAEDHRRLDLSNREWAMLDYALKLTAEPHSFGAEDRDRLKLGGFSDAEIFDINDVVAFFNYSNRMAHGLDMKPNPEYADMGR
jgi:uncharacterized peroxidase-related enzyme